MTATTRAVDVAGGLEVRSNHRDRWEIRFGDGRSLLGDLTTLPRQRNARAVRQLLLDVLPDWSDVTAAGWPAAVTAEQRDEASRVVRMVRKVVDRQSRRVHLCCGHRSCACGTDSRLDGPHYSATELEWAR